MSEWKSYKISEVGNVVTGHTPPTSKREYYGIEYKFIKPTDMREGQRYVPETEEYYSKLAFEKYKKSLLPAGTPCVVTIGSLGKKMCLTDESCFTNQAVNAVIPNEKFDGVFLFYCLKTRLAYVKQLDSGTTSGRENVSKSSFSNISIDAPDISEQRKLASILSTYDDLIENNNKRIKILEQMAENLYKEWFVRFRFPGYENAEFENGIPKGWEKSELCDVANYFCEKIDSETVNQYVSTENMQKNYGGLDRSIDSEKPEAKVTAFCKNDILVSNIRPYFKKIWFASEDGGCSNDVLNIRANQKVTAIYLFYALKRDDFFVYMTAGANGTKMPRGNKDFTMKFNLVVPSNDVMEAFSKITENIRKEIELLLRRSVILSKQRDFLLPRLMSGKLSV